MKWWVLPGLVLVAACGARPDPIFDAGTDAGTDAGVDAGPYEPPVVTTDHSLFFNEAALLDDTGLISFANLMAIAAPDHHGGPLFEQWFNAFAQGPAMEDRAQPQQFLIDFRVAHGTDPAQWDLSQTGFKMTGIHNRIDRADYSVGGHCGELRASASSTDLGLQPFHVLFIFEQPAGPGDVATDGHVTCAATARKWAELSRLDGEPLREAQRALIREGFVAERFVLIETVEQSMSPWQWRQWVPQVSSGPLPFVLVNPPLFQQVDIEGVNAPGALRDEFLTWVAENAAALDGRTKEIAPKFRKQTVTVPPVKTLRTKLSLTGLRIDVATQFPQLREQIELVGCGACHTADAEFIQTRSDRVVSPFYEKELKARERHLEKIARGLEPYAPFGPLQVDPVLPP